ncbi:hypothetical protein [Paenibacillus sp. UNC451MF]|uniref:hypothetical protein n=1 Tax=Paenibacillus sp. UNC451MF TaxID=1449063 RepID=UPI00048D3DD3|nr:hypothetical protein [Paenibacillus sp. UNC451MF]
MKKTTVSRPTRPSVHASKKTSKSSVHAPTRSAVPSKPQPLRPKPKKQRVSRPKFNNSDIMSSKSVGINGLLGSSDEAPSAVNEAQGEAAVPAVANERAGGSFLGGFGGIEGIISMMTKAQQMFKLFQQMGPIFKLISSFGGAKATTASVRTSKGTKAVRSRRGKR